LGRAPYNSRVNLATLAVLILAAPAPREAARKVLRSASCDKCHDSAVSAQNTEALAVYDLHENDWPRRMTSKQLPRLMGRLGGASAQDRKVVQQFIDAELKTRSSDAVR
jgi:hypothetical protein